MFFSDNNIALELLGVFKIKRQKLSRKSIDNRIYDSISIRLWGKGQINCEGKVYDVSPKELLYLPMNASFYQTTQGEEVIAIHFINYTHEKRNTVEKISIENNPEVEEIIQNMYRAWTEKKQGYKYICMSMLYHLLHLINNQTHTESLQMQNIKASLKEAVSYIHKNFRKDEILVSQLAKMSAMSESHFRKSFKKMYSVSPNRYIIGLKLDYASQLLKSQLYSVKEVSEKSGFSDVKYFGRIFKRHFGITPAKYKNTDIEEAYLQ